jgi:hypothetical protein
VGLGEACGLRAAIFPSLTYSSPCRYGTHSFGPESKENAMGPTDLGFGLLLRSRQGSECLTRLHGCFGHIKENDMGGACRTNGRHLH